MTELKPCPFCGSKAEIYQDYEGSWTIECTVCFARSWPRKDKEQAIEAWNRRATNEQN